MTGGRGPEPHRRDDAATPEAATPDAEAPDAEAPEARARRARAAPARRRGVVRTVTALAALVALAGAVVLGVQAWRGVARAVEAQDAAAAALDARFEAVPLLTDADLSRLRRSLNDRHVALARSLGVRPPATRAARDTLAATLVRIGGARVVAAPATYSVPALTADAAAALDSIAAAFQASTRAAGLPDARLVVTSALRSEADQAALRQVNANAAAGTSSHAYGTTADLAYRRFEPAPADSAWASAVPGWARPAAEAWLGARWQALAARSAGDYPSRYDALLGRALAALEDRGVLVALRERRQPVYHWTVARRLAAPPGPGG